MSFCAPTCYSYNNRRKTFWKLLYFVMLGLLLIRLVDKPFCFRARHKINVIYLGWMYRQEKYSKTHYVCLSLLISIVLVVLIKKYWFSSVLYAFPVVSIYFYYHAVSMIFLNDFWTFLFLNWLKQCSEICSLESKSVLCTLFFFFFLALPFLDVLFGRYTHEFIIFLNYPFLHKENVSFNYKFWRDSNLMRAFLENYIF